MAAVKVKACAWSDSDEHEGIGKHDVALVFEDLHEFFLFEPRGLEGLVR